MFRKHIADGYEAENGDYIAGEASWGEPIQCDAKPAGKADSILFPDGKRMKYTYEITLDVLTDSFQLGDHIMLLTKTHTPDRLRDSEGNLVFDKNAAQVYLRAAREYEVLGFHRYAYICKLWV